MVPRIQFNSYSGVANVAKTAPTEKKDLDRNEELQQATKLLDKVERLWYKLFSFASIAATTSGIKLVLCQT